MTSKKVLLITLIAILSWLWMMIVHEFGHVLVGIFSGGAVSKVVLHPLELSRTELSVNLHPLAVAWGGPVVGCIVPLMVWVALKTFAWRSLHLFQWFTGFCLIANGVYIGSGANTRIGDAGEMLAYGSDPWMLALFGLVTVPLGFFLWNGPGSKFGIGNKDESTSTSAILVCGGLLALTVGAELLHTALARFP